MTTNRDAVRRGLDQLKARLAAYVSAVVAKFPTVKAPVPHADIAALIRFILDNPGMFRLDQNRRLRTYLHEVREARNEWAHEHSFTDGDADRALDTMRRLAEMIGRPMGDSPAPVAPSAAPPPRAAATARPTQRTQRDVMRDIWRRVGPDEDRAVRAYADAERRGEAPRKSNRSGKSAEDYARALLKDARRHGWLAD
jgi:hypothetical protein